ncbi:MAG: hypothetical protein IVW57_13395 [Ktedonobacterales bacterium]|nr:hypothetical protein [Ktedonobacterales bacterium]
MRSHIRGYEGSVGREGEARGLSMVRRLMYRLSHVFSFHASSQDGARGRPPTPAAAPATLARPMRIANWLEDGKLLRPRVAAVMRLRRAEAAAVRAAAEAVAAEAERQRVVSGHTRGESVSVPIPPPLPERAAATLPLPALPPIGELASVEATVDAAEGLDVVQRRLIFVRYLVRQRIYNEGFAPDALPAQYRWDGGPEGHSDN